jgi:hypothetical protein
MLVHESEPLMFLKGKWTNQDWSLWLCESRMEEFWEMPKRRKVWVQLHDRYVSHSVRLDRVLYYCPPGYCLYSAFLVGEAANFVVFPYNVESLLRRVFSSINKSTLWVRVMEKA